MKKTISLLMTVLLLFGMMANVISVSAETMAEFDDDSGQTAVDYGFFQALTASNGDYFVPGQPACYAWEIAENINVDYPLAGMDQNIVSLFGLQYATSVEEINISFNPRIGKGLPDGYEWGQIPEQGYLYMTTLKNLLSLDLSYNMLDADDMKYINTLSSLQTLNLDGNKFETFPDLTGLTNLISLSLSNCELTEIPVDKLPKSLRILLLTSDKIDTSGLMCMGVDYFAEYYNKLSGNHITDISGLTQLPNLTKVYLDGNNIDVNDPMNSMVIAQMGNKLDLGTQNVEPGGDDPVVVKFKDSRLKKLVAAELKVSASADITDEMMLKLTTLMAGESDITDLTGLEYAVNLETLSIYDNNISDLTPIKNLKNIKNFAISNNFITSIDAISGYSKLVMADVSSNKISDLSALSNKPNLKILIASDTNVTDISYLKGLNSLEKVVLSYTNLGDASVLGNFTNIYDLDLYDSGISDISAFKNLVNLRYADLSNNNITDISALSNLNKLEEIDIRYNYIDISAGSAADKIITQIKNQGAYITYSPQKEIPVESHTVTFYVDGEVYATKEVKDGEALTDIPAVPTVEGKTGAWNVTDFSNIKADVRVDAVYEDITYTVSFYANNKLVASKTVVYGGTLTDIPAVPTVEGKTGAWNITNFSNIKADMRVDAVYEDITYTVSFYANNSLVASKTVVYGGTLTDIPAVPEVEGKTGTWNVTNFSNIKADVRVDAVYEDITYTVSFYANNSLVASKTVAYGGTLTDIPAVPTVEGKTGTWNVTNFSNIKADMRVDAVYEDITYTVSFYANNSLVASKTVAYGGTLTDIPAVPTVEGKTGAWNVTDFSNIKADMRVDAVYDDITLTITFYVNNNVYTSRQVAFGATLTDIPAVPEVTGKTGRWDRTNFTSITSDMRVDAVYEDITYTVSFYANNSLVASKTVAYGGTLTDIPAVPEVEGKTGAWNVTNFSNIKADMRVDAVYEDITYTVSFYANNSLVASKTVAYGGTLTDIPAVPAVEGKTGTWSVTNFSNIKADMRVDAVYEDIQTGYTVTFYVDGEVYATKHVEDGQALTDVPAVPEKAGYYASWDTLSFDNITSNMTVNAVYVPLADVDPADLKVKVKTPFAITIRTKNTVTNIGIKNEAGKFIGKHSMSSVVDSADPDFIIWTVYVSIDTKGLGRQLSVWIQENGEFIDSTKTITADVLADDPVVEENGPKLIGEDAIAISASNVKVNEQFTLTIKTNVEVANIKLQSEAGNVLGKLSQSYTEENGVRTWTIVTRFGSKGVDRRIDVSLSGDDGKFTDVVGSTGTIQVTK